MASSKQGPLAVYNAFFAKYKRQGAIGELTTNGLGQKAFSVEFEKTDDVDAAKKWLKEYGKKRANIYLSFSPTASIRKNS